MNDQERWLHEHAECTSDNVWRCRTTGALIALAARETRNIPADCTDLAGLPGVGSYVCTGCIQRNSVTST